MIGQMFMKFKFAQRAGKSVNDFLVVQNVNLKVFILINYIF